MKPEPQWQFAVEKGIPCPTRRDTKSTAAKLRNTYAAMKPGDSFAADVCVQDAHWAARQVGVKIRTHQLDNGGLRIWRLS